MAASKVDICNNALRRLGQNSIVSLTEDSPQARMCNQIYDSVRDAVLSSHPWNCLLTRTTLSVLGSSPNHGYDYQFQLPTDPYCLRVLEADCEEDGYKWKVEGRKLLADTDDVSIIYVARDDSPANYSPFLYELMIARLAAELSYYLTRDKVLTQSMFELYNMKLKEARAMDGMEGTPPVLESNTLWQSRY